MFGAYPARYQPAFAFSVILYPQGRGRGLLPFYSFFFEAILRPPFDETHTGLPRSAPHT